MSPGVLAFTVSCVPTRNQARLDALAKSRSAARRKGGRRKGRRKGDTVHLRLDGAHMYGVPFSRRNDRLVVEMELAENSMIALLGQGLSDVQYLGYIVEAAGTLDDLHRR